LYAVKNKSTFSERTEKIFLTKLLSHEIKISSVMLFTCTEDIRYIGIGIDIAI
jgi:hypothetical protein